MKVDRPTFTLVLRPEPHIDPIKSLRAVLKVLLRGYGMKCISAVDDQTKEDVSDS